MNQDAPPDPRLCPLTREPANAETRLAQHVGLLTPTTAFYQRNHFAIPALAAADWRLTVGGTVERPLTLTYDELRALPSQTATVTIECAGNGRAGLQPPVAGEPWGYGAVSTAEWTGVRLSRVLDAAGLAPETCEIVITGADAGHEPGVDGVVSYARGLPLATARHDGTMLAYAMNGELLTPAHGFPVRLVVAGWYGMAAVKWVTGIEASAERFRGFFQAQRYVLPDPAGAGREPIPLTLMAVRSVIADPAEGARLPVGTRIVRGFAWSGAAPIARVELSADDGRTWQPAELTGDAGPYAWRRWECVWQARAAGPARLKSRATDARGHTQPEEPAWNRLGYANNAIQVVQVAVE
jgi:DMSO/TMAO reductase YedYZ molybdopterin-dependent catalytic subunit